MRPGTGMEKHYPRLHDHNTGPNRTVSRYGKLSNGSIQHQTVFSSLEESAVHQHSARHRACSVL